MSKYPYTSLNFIEKNIPEMEALGVSKVARSRGQFIDQYRKAGGNPSRLPEFWRKKRDAFCARFYQMWKQYRTRRIYLACVAWAFDPTKL